MVCTRLSVLFKIACERQVLLKLCHDDNDALRLDCDEIITCQVCSIMGNTAGLKGGIRGIPKSFWYASNTSSEIKREWNGMMIKHKCSSVYMYTLI
jgi:hypothetical protein